VDLEIAGEVALVLGGSKGLGFACALELASAGVKVAINGRNAADGAVAVKKLGEGAIFVQGDVAEPVQIVEIVNAVQTKHNRAPLCLSELLQPTFDRFVPHVQTSAMLE
jgi:3-oxoacyl-[acyl-carrier protein] reductase